MRSERDERGVDVRPRPEDLARDRMEAGALGRELDEHRHRAVRLRPRRGEEAVGDLALHHHAPALDGRQAVEALDDDRRRDVVRQVRDELRRRRLERAEVERERVAASASSVVRRCRARSGSSERSISTAWTCATRSARKRVRTPRPGPISSTTSSGRARRAARSRRGCSRRRGSAGRAASSARPLTARRRRSAFASIWRCELGRRPRRAPRRARRACGRRSPARSAAADGLRREVRAVGLGEEAVGGHAARRLAEVAAPSGR